MRIKKPRSILVTGLGHKVIHTKRHACVWQGISREKACLLAVPKRVSMVSSSGFIVFPLAVFLHYIRKRGPLEKEFQNNYFVENDYHLCMYFLSQKLYTEHETCLKEGIAR